LLQGNCADDDMPALSYRAAVAALAACTPMKHLISGLAAWSFSAAALAQSCPLDPAASTALRLAAADLAALPQTERVQRRTLAATDAAAQPALEQSVRYSGVLLRDVLARVVPADTHRAARTLVFEAVATDGYRAVFTWGEIFNSSAGDQVLVISAQDGHALGNDQGPLALRALADLRPGPRHVRNLCGVVVR
jgi:Oxidoreductase molybdopterin binding domain